MSEQCVASQSELLSEEQLAQILKERPFFVAAAATLMTQCDGQLPPLVLRPPGAAGGFWLESMTQPQAGVPLSGIDHQPCFRLLPELTIGTIDELVADYRTQLLRSVTVLVQSLPHIDRKNPCGARWSLSGTRDKPTLSPSLHWVGMWHGYLRDGNLQSC